MGNRDSAILYAKRKESLCQKHDVVQPDLYQEYGVKRGLRDEEGRGVLTGLTNISEITAFREENGKKIPCDGQLLYRGYDVKDLVKGSMNQRFVFEEGAYLLLFGELPNTEELHEFQRIIADSMEMPTNFTSAPTLFLLFNVVAFVLI